MGRDLGRNFLVCPKNNMKNSFWLERPPSRLVEYVFQGGPEMTAALVYLDHKALPRQFLSCLFFSRQLLDSLLIIIYIGHSWVHEWRDFMMCFTYFIFCVRESLIMTTQIHTGITHYDHSNRGFSGSGSSLSVIARRPDYVLDLSQLETKLSIIRARTDGEELIEPD